MLKSFEEFLNSENVNESIDLSPGKFAIVRVGGSIGNSSSYPVFISDKIGSITETGDDQEELKETAKRLRNRLSPGEKKYYGMTYRVIKLTPGKIKEIKYLQDFRNKSEDSTVD